MQGVTMQYPLQEPHISGKRDDSVALDVKIPHEAIVVNRKQGIDEPKELHDALILSKIFVACTRSI
jgi:hypothetical protein